MHTLRTPQKRVLAGAIGLVLLTALAMACSSGYGTGPTGGDEGGSTTSIDAVGISFGPANDTVAVGATVTWTIRSGGPHTVTANDGSFDSGSRSNGQTFQHTFATAGTYRYYCRFHGSPDSGMRGVIVVQ